MEFPPPFSPQGSLHIPDKIRQQLQVLRDLYGISSKKEGANFAPPLKLTAAIRYLCPECVIRIRMSRRLSATEAPANSARSAALHLLIVALMASAHLSILSALG